jgi:hypothetical protein
VKFGTGGNYASFQVDRIDDPGSALKDYPESNMGHRPAVKDGYFPVPPVDGDSDLRAEMVSTIGEMGLSVEKHHVEVAQSQHELGTNLASLTTMAGQMEIYKYCVHNVAHSYGKTATFMPKPIYGDNGSAMHTHFSIWKAGKPLFAGNGYADLPEMCLHAIGGIIKHAKAINAFTNPPTNNYKRLIPGFEAPVLLAYSARIRSASCRIPLHHQPEGEARRGALPRCGRQSVPGVLCRHHGGARRYQQQESFGLKEGRQGNPKYAADRVYARARCGAKQETATVLVDLDGTQIEQIVNDAFAIPARPPPRTAEYANEGSASLRASSALRQTI